VKQTDSAASASRAVHHRRTDCRLCGGTRLTEVLSLAPTPPANAFVDRPGVEQPSFPLDVFFCEECGHVQLLDVIDPEALFSNYVYASGTSPVFIQHFRNYAADLVDEFGLTPGTLAVDIGSNDGTFLRFLKEANLVVLGIDPARDIARRTTEAGIETLPVFFTAEIARELRATHGEAGLISANNVFAHIDDLAGVVEAVRAWLAPTGIFAFEVSYLADVFQSTLFDTIYHEHLDYHAVKPLVPFFERAGMELISARRVPTHGGSIRCVVQRRGGPHAIDTSVRDRIGEEARLGIDRAETLIGFAAKIDEVGRELRALLRDIKGRGHTIAGFGAPAKATTLLHHFEIGPDMVDFIVDDSPLKQGLYTPGMHIPVVSSAAIAERRPDYLIILAWNFAEPIMRGQAEFTRRGGRFIVPLPSVIVH
jgi:SAM-dependent methyltransferase